MWINLKQFVFETEVKAFLRICYYLHLYFQGILCNRTLVGFIDITDIVYYGTDFQNLYSYRSFIYLLNTLMAKNSTPIVDKLLLSAKRVPRSF